MNVNPDEYRQALKDWNGETGHIIEESSWFIIYKQTILSALSICADIEFQKRVKEVENYNRTHKLPHEE